MIRKIQTCELLLARGEPKIVRSSIQQALKAAMRLYTVYTRKLLTDLVRLWRQTLVYAAKKQDGFMKYMVPSCFFECFRLQQHIMNTTSNAFKDKNHVREESEKRRTRSNFKFSRTRVSISSLGHQRLFWKLYEQCSFEFLQVYQFLV